MHRFYLPPDQCNGNQLVLTDREAHHALHVLRLRRAEPVVALDGAGREFLCEVEDCARASVKLAVIGRNMILPPPCQITLVQAVPKGKIIEDIIQKATELGVSRVVPLLSQRVTMHLDAGEAAHKTGKWRLIAVEAIKQCGSAWLPQIEVPVTPEQFLARKESFELPLVASLQTDRRHPREYFHDFQTRHSRPPRTICVWVGPEGDFTPEELAAIKSSGALPMTLGRLVLRVETAAIYCLSILNYELPAPVT